MQVSKFYDLAAFDRLAASGRQKSFIDSCSRALTMHSGFADAASAGVVLARNLTAVDPQIFEKKFPELAFVNSGIVTDNSGGAARSIQSLRVLDEGDFATAGDSSGNKGKISLSSEDSQIPVVIRQAHSEWAETEVAEAALQNVNLVSKYIEAANRRYMRNIDEVGYLGVPDKPASTGLLNHAGFLSGAATGAIATLSAQQMYDDIADLITSQHNAVNNTPEYMANRVDMPIYVLNTLNVIMLNTAASPSSVLKALQGNFPGVTFQGTFRADNAGGVGVSHTVAYSNNSEVIKMRIPTPLTVGEIIKVTSFDFRVDYMYRIAGADILEDTGGYILTGL